MILTHGGVVVLIYYAYRTQSYRTLRDGSRIPLIPGNKLPGYDRLVPTGQSPAGPDRMHHYSVEQDGLELRFGTPGDPLNDLPLCRAAENVEPDPDAAGFWLG
jgi:hypothetical protein